MSKVAANYSLSQLKRTNLKAHDHKKHPRQLGRIVAVKFVCDYLATNASGKTPSSKAENRFVLLSGNEEAKRAFVGEVVSLIRKSRENTADLTVKLSISDELGEKKEISVFDFQRKTLERAKEVIGNSGKLTENDKSGLTQSLDKEIVRIASPKFDKSNKDESN